MTGPQTWRVGRKLGRTLYVDDHVVGMVDTPELASRIAAAMNHGSPHNPSPAPAAARDNGAEVDTAAIRERMRADSASVDDNEVYAILDALDEARLDLADELRAQEEGYLGQIRGEFTRAVNGQRQRAEKAEAQRDELAEKLRAGITAAYADIATAREERALRAEAQVAAVRALHVRVESNPPPDVGPWCAADGRPWPCPTLAAMDGAVPPPAAPMRKWWTDSDAPAAPIEPVSLRCASTLGEFRCDLPTGHRGGHENDTGGAYIRWPDPPAAPTHAVAELEHRRLWAGHGADLGRDTGAYCEACSADEHDYIWPCRLLGRPAAPTHEFVVDPWRPVYGLCAVRVPVTFKPCGLPASDPIHGDPT